MNSEMNGYSMVVNVVVIVYTNNITYHQLLQHHLLPTNQNNNDNNTTTYTVLSYSSVLRIRIHRIMIHTDEIPQYYDERYILCVWFVSHTQLYLLSVTIIKLYVGANPNPNSWINVNQIKNYFFIKWYLMSFNEQGKWWKINDFHVLVDT